MENIVNTSDKIALTIFSDTLSNLECLPSVERNCPVERIRGPHHQLLRGSHSGWLWWRLNTKFSRSIYLQSDGYLDHWLLEVINMILYC